MRYGLQHAQDARVLFVDMNAFFASVEQQHHPELRNRPLAVVSHIAPRGTVLAASYEAKQYGVSTGMRIKEAQERCANLILTNTSPALYRACHQGFVRILRNLFGPEVQVRSIDEAAIPLSPNWRGSEYCHRHALKIKAAFRQELGEWIRCSVGIGPNIFLAKLATNLQKPDGLVEITLANTPEILSRLELTDLPGIATRMATQLNLRDIHTPLGLYNRPASELYLRLGVWGQQWWWRLHGFETDGFGTATKSMSHQHVLQKWQTTRQESWPIILRMADRLAYRLCRNHYYCRRLWLYLRLSEAPPLLRERHFDAPIGGYAAVIQAVRELTDTLPSSFAGPARMITLTVDGLTESRHGLQLDLFDRQLTQESVGNAVTQIRSRFGFEAILPATLVGLDRKLAPDQVGFGQVRDHPPENGTVLPS